MARTRPSAWAAVLRSALLFTPFFVVVLVALVVLVLDTAGAGATTGRVIALVLVGFVALLLAYQVVQSVRDLFSRLTETTGPVERCWSRNEFMLFRNSYVFVGKNVYRLTPEQFLDIELGDTVRIVHYPHTSAVESIEVVEKASQAGRQQIE